MIKQSFLLIQKKFNIQNNIIIENKFIDKKVNNITIKLN